MVLAIKGAKVGSWNTKSLTLWGDTHFEPMIKKAFEDLAASEASAKRKMGKKK